MKFRFIKKIAVTTLVAIMAVGMTSSVSNAASAGIKGSITSKLITGTFQYSEQGHQLKIELVYKKLNLVSGTKVNGEHKAVSNGAYTDVGTAREVEKGYNYLYMWADGYVDGVKKATLSTIHA
ncbi:MAG: hypothetical protein HDT30_11635 [Clostridiales bacterium]|nr:hypothetical protein [Clostridiales bacterium]